MRIIQGSLELLEKEYKSFWLKREPYLGKSVTEEDYEEKHKYIRSRFKSICLFLALDGDRVVGRLCACVQFEGAGMILGVYGEHVGFVKGLYVDVEYRNRGIGKAMMQEAERWFKNWGCENVVLNVVEGNEGGLRFYEREGYKPVHRMMKKSLD